MARTDDEQPSLLEYLRHVTPEDIDRDLEFVRRQRLKLRAQEQLLLHAKQMASIDGMGTTLVSMQLMLLNREEDDAARAKAAPRDAEAEDAADEPSPSADPDWTS